VLKILYVDDDPNMQKMVELFMRKSRHELTIAKNGRSALKFLEKNLYDVIVTDIQMPELDGLALIDEIKKRKIETPVIIVSAFGQESISQKGLKKGAAKILRKPFESKELFETIEKYSKNRQ
jgi:two-component system, NtrC family, response regulator HydG